MLNSIHSSSAPACTPPQVIAATAAWADHDDVAFGCECADPSLQIDSWGQESPEFSSAALSVLECRVNRRFGVATKTKNDPFTKIRHRT